MAHLIQAGSINAGYNNHSAKSIFSSVKYQNIIVFVVLLFTAFMINTCDAAIMSLQMDSTTAFSILGVSCGGIQQQDFSTGFDTSGNISGEIYLQTRCGSSGVGGGYTTTTYSSWVGVTWDLTGSLINNTVLSSVPTDYSYTFSAFDAQNDRIYNTLTALNVTPGQCTVGNTTYCTYQAFLDTAPAPVPVPGSIWLLGSGVLMLLGIGGSSRTRIHTT